MVAHRTELTFELAEGVELLELYGYNPGVVRGGGRVFLGDVHAGETRKVVARVRVPDRKPGLVDVVSASVGHVDSNAGTPDGRCQRDRYGDS